MRNICLPIFASFLCQLLLGPIISFADPPPALPPAMRYAPPEATFTGAAQLQLLQDDVKQSRFDAASARLEALLRDSGDALMSQSEDGSVLSIGAWIADLPAEMRNQLRPSYEAAGGPAADQAVAEIQAKPDADPADLYALACRYPLAHASLGALADAARRSALLGDIPTARWMLDTAVAGGWLADPALAHQIDLPPAQPSAYLGMIPFRASWFGSNSRRAWSALRSFPTAAGDAIFVVGPAQVVAMKENGALLWKGPADAVPSPGRGASAMMGVTRGPSFAPAMLCDASGTAQLLVVRQPEVRGDGWALRALRTQDGHLLWTTEGQEAYHGLVFGSNAAIEGRYVYAVAGECSDQLDHLWLVAIEATTGRQLWRCDIGTVSRTAGQRPKNNMPQMDSFRPWLNQSAPCVANNLVITTPDIAAAIAVDRFDGKLQWTRGYPTLSDPTSSLQRQRDWALEHPATPLPPATGLSMRWANTPAVSGDAVVIAPQDSDQVLALNVHDGKPLWQPRDAADATLLGISGGVAVLAGESTFGVNVTDGKTAWTNTQLSAVGPSVLRSATVYSPIASGILVSSAADGTTTAEKEPAGREKVPAFDKAIATDPAHSVLLANDVGHCFGPARKP